ncbi:hypothetical protein FFLO_01629 [Filobasidium floriforme]|uniref:Uncharacterized protein n=1 Tax=Filobasidium floriforme TaxID=5210 RepID=A0A8K0NSH6_9TREE|nr:uncharacterized protein HD553DRAFT_317155 [Filobasidium floriforme]KAG7562939.1 hypothetical protein FFLO_01629 [Filobasidium floriforme]KAH8080608.1 hypothetical protein HD553DRAFT_317155 [Filobasidium floriforme]
MIMNPSSLRYLRGRVRSTAPVFTERTRCLSSRPSKLNTAPASSTAPAPSSSPAGRRTEPDSGGNLVGPSDPISNLRPVIYRSKNPSSSSSASSSRPSASSPATGRSGTDYTPYSISEFSSVSSSGRDRSGSDRRLGEDLAERLRKEAVDRKNHEFWAKTNLLFEAHQAHRLSLLGPAPSPTTSSPDEIARYAADKEKVLAEFYRDWIHANKDRQARWVWEWWADVREDVGSGLRKGLKRLFG